MWYILLVNEWVNLINELWVKYVINNIYFVVNAIIKLINKQNYVYVTK